MEKQIIAALNPKKLIVVLGMHRSGTSAITRGLKVMGVELGERLMQPFEGINNKGFWEDIDIYSLNVEMLLILESNWHYLSLINKNNIIILKQKGYFERAVDLILQKTNIYPTFGIKDPRITKLLLFWKEVFEYCNIEINYIIATRNPISVAKSLEKRDGFDIEKSLYLWLGHVINSFSLTTESNRIIINYDNLIQDPKEELEKIANKFKLEINKNELNLYINDFLDINLRHNYYIDDELLKKKKITDLVIEIYDFILSNSTSNIKIEENIKVRISKWESEIKLLDPLFDYIDKLSLQLNNDKIIINETNQNLEFYAQKTNTLNEENKIISEQLNQHKYKINSLESDIILKNIEIEKKNSDLEEKSNLIIDLKEEIKKINHILSKIITSNSWRLTAPLRQLINIKFSKEIKNKFSSLKLKYQNRANKVNKKNTPHFAPPTNDYSLLIPFNYNVTLLNPSPKIAVICHIFYTDLLEEIISYLNNIPYKLDLFITTDSNEKYNLIKERFINWGRGEFTIKIVENRGRDIAPKLLNWDNVYETYEYFLHIHTKKSLYESTLENWRLYLYDSLIGSEEIVKSIFEAFNSDKKIGIIAPQHFANIKHEIGWGWNFDEAKKFAKKIGINLSINKPIDFPSGSMFWARSEAIKPLLESGLTIDDFPIESGQNDNTLSHVIERLYFYFCEKSEYKWIKIINQDKELNPERSLKLTNKNELINSIDLIQRPLLKKQRYFNKIFINILFHIKKLKTYNKKLALQNNDNSIIDFNEDFYLKVNKDVAKIVSKGLIESGYKHYLLYGQAENRLFSNNLITRKFNLLPNFPEGMFEPVNIRSKINFNFIKLEISESNENFLLIFFSHLQTDLFYAGYNEFFNDFLPVFDSFKKIVISVESEMFEPLLAKKYCNKIEVINQKFLININKEPNLIICFNSHLFNKASKLFRDLNKIIYYCQEYEAGFFPFGTNYIERVKAIANSKNIIISTVLLYNFLDKRNLLVNNNIFITSPKIDCFDVKPEKQKKLFFYFRPESFHSRNIPEILWEGVHEFCNKHEGYEIYLVGTIDTRFSFQINNTNIFVLNKLPKDEYIKLISSCDVVIAMIYSAHPGVIAFQAAASGIPTITNVFENRDDNVLKSISKNIVPFDPINESLLSKIEEALTMTKGIKSFNETLYSGTKNTISFVNYIEKICNKI